MMRRLTGTIASDPDGAGDLHYAAIRNSYDSAGRLVKVETGELSDWQSESVAPQAWTGFTVFRTVETSYDAMGRKIREQLREGAAGTVRTLTQYSYDIMGRLECQAIRMNPAIFASLPSSACMLGTQGIDGPDRITRNVYDAAGQRLQLREGVGTPDEGAEATWAYNASGQVATMIDGNGNRAELHYDGHGRQDRWTFPSLTRPGSYNDATQASALASAGSVNASDYEGYEYDPNGNRTSLRKRAGRHIFYAYDALNRVTSKTYPEGGANAVAYSYDLRGLQLSALYGASGQGITNVYDGFGRLASSTSNMGGTARALTYAYDRDGARTSITHPDGIWFGIWQDGLDRPYYLHANGATGISYAYFADAGAVTGQWRNGTAELYGYDPIQRLSSIYLYTTQPLGQASWSYTRNAAGGVASVTRDNDNYAWTGAYTVNRGYTANGLNQYSAAGSTTLTYDANGNLASETTQNVTRTYVYDVENRLVSSSNGATLSYDPLGRLWQVASGSNTTRFLYDGDALAAEYDAAGNVLHRYAHWEGADVPMIAYDGATLANPRNLLSDHQGSIVTLSDAAGMVVALNTYDEYGIPGAGNVGRFQYTGQAWLAELGMYYYKARIYSPTLGRFMQTDPIGYEGGINLYEYVEDDPIDRTDPTGNDCCYGSNGYHLPPMDGSNFLNRVANAIDGLSIGLAVVEVFGTDGAAAAGPAEETVAIGRTLSAEVRALGRAEARRIERTAVERTPTGRRVGEFTRAQREAAKTENAARNGGRMLCTDCGRPLQSVRSERGVPTPRNQAQVHHDPPISQGGGRHSTPEVLCPRCHIARGRIED